MIKIVCLPKWYFILLMIFFLVISYYVITNVFQSLFITERKNIFGGILMILVYLGSGWSVLENLFITSKKYTFLDSKVIVYDMLKLKTYHIEYTEILSLLMGEQSFSMLSKCKFIEIRTKRKKIKLLSFSHTNTKAVYKFLLKKHKVLFPYANIGLKIQR